MCEICGFFSFKNDSCPTSHCGEAGFCLHPVWQCFDDKMLRISNCHIFDSTEMRTWDNHVMLTCTKISTLFTTFSFLDENILNTRLLWIHYFPLTFNSFQFRSNLIHPQVHIKSIYVCFAHNRPIVVSSSEFHSKRLSSMNGWQILQLQPTQRSEVIL